jgi:aldehyde dehydrogenase
MIYAAPGAAGAKIAYKPATTTSSAASGCPGQGQYFDVITPVNGKVYTQAARSSAEDIELAWTPPMPPLTGARPPPPSAPTCCSRSPTASKQNLELLAYAETVDNGKPIRET